MRSTICTICRTDDNSVLIYPEFLGAESIDAESFSARRSPQDRRAHHRMVKCKSCGLLRSDPMLEFEELAKLYGTSKFTYDQEVKYLQQTYGKYILPAMKFVVNSRRYLDIGCGNGFMLETAQNLGFKEVYGVEPSQDAVDKAQENIKRHIHVGMFERGVYDDNYFDFITIFQTLDHFPDPLSILQEVHRILKPGGVVFAINHDLGSWTNKLMGEKSPIIDIEHTYLYTKVTQRKLFESSGLATRQVFSVVNRYPLNYIIWLLPINLKFKQAFLKLAQISHLGQLTLSVYLGNLGIISQKNEPT